MGFMKIRKSGNIVKGDTNTKRSWWVSQGWVPTWQAYLAWQTGKCLKEESLDGDERKETDTPTCWKIKWTYSNSSWYPAFSNRLSSNTKEWQIVSNCFQKKDCDHKTQDISGSAPHVTGTSTNEKPLSRVAQLSWESWSLRILCISGFLVG